MNTESKRKPGRPATGKQVVTCGWLTLSPEWAEWVKAQPGTSRKTVEAALAEYRRLVEYQRRIDDAA